MAAFESIGTMLENGVAGYAEQISGSLISNISPVIFSGVSLYFLLKGWMFLTGRADGAISDTVITAFKIALISMVGLNTGNFVSWGMGFINGAEALLMDSLPSGSASNGWAAIDAMWKSIGSGIVSLWQLIGNLDWNEISAALLLVLLLFAFFIAGAFLTLAALGVFIIAKLSLVVVMGFGPLFICLLMFPLTRSWFDGWLKSCMTYVFTVVIMAAVISLVTEVFSSRVEMLSSMLNRGLSDGVMADFMTSVFTFLIICVGLATLVKAIPAMASGVTGGIGMGAVGLGQMLRGVGGAATRMGAAAVAANAIGRGNASLARASMDVMSGRTTGAMLTTQAVGSGIRYVRALNAARALQSSSGFAPLSPAFSKI